MRKNQLEAIALTGMTEGKRSTGRQKKMFMDWISTACGDQWTVTKFWKFVKNVMSICWSPTSRVWHGTYIGSECAYCRMNTVIPKVTIT